MKKKNYKGLYSDVFEECKEMTDKIINSIIEHFNYQYGGSEYTTLEKKYEKIMTKTVQ